MSLNHFPTALPVQEAGVVIGYIRGSTVDGHPISRDDAKEAAWWVAGYALNQVTLGGQVMMVCPVPDDQQEAYLAGHLEAAVAPQGTTKGAIAIPWGIILPILLNLLQKWLGK